MMPSAPGAVILNLPAHSNITIIPTLQTRKGIFRSATNAAIFVRTLFACSPLPVVADVPNIKGLLHRTIIVRQILKALRANAWSHRQNDAELGLAAHHSVIGLARLFQRIS